MQDALTTVLSPVFSQGMLVVEEVMEDDVSLVWEPVSSLSES